MKLFERESKCERMVNRWITNTSDNYMNQIFDHIPACSSTVSSIQPYYYAKTASNFNTI